MYDELTQHTMWACLVLFALSVISALGGSIYLLRQLRLLQGISQLTVIRKRYPRITNVVVYVSLLYFVTLCLQSALIAFQPAHRHIAIHTDHTALRAVSSSLSLVCFQCLLYLQLLRFWLMYFDVRYTISALEREWTVYLDPSKAQQNWFFSHIDTYGNMRWLLPRLAAIWGVSVTLCLVANALIYVPSVPARASMDLVILVFELAPILVNYGIHANTPTFYDHYYMRGEMRWITHLFLVLLSLDVVRFVTTRFVMSALMDVVHALLACAELLVVGALCFVCTGWVVRTISREYGSYVDAQQHSVADKKRLQQDLATTEFRFIYMPPQPSNLLLRQSKTHDAEEEEEEEEKDDTKEEDSLRLPRFTFPTKKNLEDIEISKKLKLAEILSCNESFTLFQQHLARESSSSEYKNVACLLSFVEYVQFKQLLKDTLPSMIHAGTFGRFRLASSIPQSSIVHENIFNANSSNNVNMNMSSAQLLLREYKGRAYHLYCKYIKDDAELKLRLPSEQRQVLDAQMDELDKLINSDMDANQLFHIFDDVLICQYEIMWKSYQRFVNTSDYLLVQEFIRLKQKKERKTTATTTMRH